MRIAAIVVMSMMLATVGARADDASDCEKATDYNVEISACSRIIRRDPNAAWAYTNRSYAYERLDRGEEALADANRAIELDKNKPVAWVNRAAAKIRLKDYQGAIADTNQAMKIDPGRATAFVNRAYAYEQLGERDRAIADYRRTLELDPGKQYARDALKRLGSTP